MTAHRSKRKRRNKKKYSPPKQRVNSIIDYPMQFPIPAHFKEQLRIFHGETPSSLFKFERPGPERIAALQLGLAYFSSPDRFNDTQDCRLAIDGNISNEELESALSPENRWLTAIAPSSALNRSPAEVIADQNAHMSIAYFKTIQAEYRHGARRLRRKLDQLAKMFSRPARVGGIYCLTDNWCNEMMWEKYASNGSGFVLEFDSQMCAICWDASPVDYVDSFQMIKLYSAAMAGSLWNDTLRVPLTKLRMPWEQEREWRTWRMIQGFYRYSPESLVSVTFGPNIEDKLAQTLLAIVLSKYFPRTHVYEAKIIDGQLVRVPML